MCLDVRYRNIGCFNDFHWWKRPLPNRLTLPEGESAGLKLKNFTVILNNATLKAWNDDLYQFVCTCAKAAKNKGYKYFGVLNFGKLTKLLCSGFAYLLLTRRVSRKAFLS